MQIISRYTSVDGLCARLQTDAQSGLAAADADEVKRRQKAFGVNELPATPPKSFFRLVLSALADHVLIALLIISVVVIGVSFIPKKSDGSEDGEC